MLPTAENRKDDRFANGVGCWVDICQRRAVLVLVASILISIAAVFYLAENLRIDTDNEDMLSADLAFRQNAIALDQAFPVLDSNLLVVFEAPNADAADDGVRRLADAMQAKDEIFEDVFAAEADPFLRKHGFLFLETTELEDLSLRLASAQPFLGTLWQQPNLSGLAGMLELIADADTDTEASTSTEAAAVLDKMADVAERVRAGKDAHLVWSEVILGAKPTTGPVRRLIQTRPKLDYGSLHPAARASDTVHEIAQNEGLLEGGYNLRLTGSAALESDELKSVEEGMGLAGLISLTIVVLVLMIGIRSLGVMVALFLTLIFGLLWTGAFAILALGSLNLISVAFAVLFVGLSVDFGIHFVLRAVEYSGLSGQWSEALAKGGRSVGGSLAICALTTAIAFFSFLPTDYVGLAELGLIAGVGMFIALICNLTVFPALLRLLVRKPPVLKAMHETPHPQRRFRKSAAKIVMIGVVSAIVSAWFAMDTRFDFDPMNLKDPEAPSVVTLFDLMGDGDIHPYSSEILATDMAVAEKMIAELQTLDAVDNVDSIFSLIPDQQAAKLAIIERMALFMGPAFFAPPGVIALSGQNLDMALNQIAESLSALSSDAALGPAATRLAAALNGTRAEQAARINQALFKYLPGRLEDLVTALEASEVDVAGLPAELKSRYLSKDGSVRLDVRPKADLRDTVRLREFVEAVQSVAPQATGGPIIIVEAGRAVLDAFGKALVIALLGIGCVLWVVLRRLRDVFLVFAPVCVAALWTLAVSAVAGVPFNFANVIVLPLLFGLSVDFGIHIVLRQRAIVASDTDHHDAMSTTTPRAVLLSALTTLGSFGSIMLSGHPGTASMGLLLSIAISLSLVAILIFLPALMALMMRSRDAGHSDKGHIDNG